MQSFSKVIMLAHCILFAPSYVNNWLSMFVFFFSFVCLSVITLCLVVFLVFSFFKSHFLMFDFVFVAQSLEFKDNASTSML